MKILVFADDVLIWGKVERKLSTNKSVDPYYNSIWTRQ
jgi:hypothetical protein